MKLPKLVFKKGHCPGCEEKIQPGGIFECHASCGRPCCIKCAPLPHMMCGACK